ncbi:MAG TPA: invasion associated locus B family protein [Rhizobiaceae bacterium]|nr:invasion associated locus B family protein [Rhizobiaceae bacterium]
MRLFDFFKVTAAAAAVMAASALASAQEAGSKLPGGASSLQENYEAWNVVCQGVPKTLCSISQQQTQQNGQRVLAAELQLDENETFTGTLVLPFGLLLDAGVTLQVDEAEPRDPIAFQTCLPAGCLARLSFDAKMLSALRSGTALKIKVQNTDGKEVNLSVPLKGLAAALDRLAALSGA